MKIYLHNANYASLLANQFNNEKTPQCFEILNSLLKNFLFLILSISDLVSNKFLFVFLIIIVIKFDCFFKSNRKMKKKFLLFQLK